MALGTIFLFVLLSLIVLIIIGALGVNKAQFSKLNTLNIDIANSSVLVSMIGLLIAILLLPSLKKVKIGQVELDTAPIRQKEIELEPNISNPSSKSVRISSKSLRGKVKPVLTLFQRV